jgi:hypothetical protein
MDTIRKKTLIMIAVSTSLFLLFLIMLLGEGAIETNNLVTKAGGNRKFCNYRDPDSFLAKTETTMVLWIIFIIGGPVIMFLTICIPCMSKNCHKTAGYSQIGVINSNGIYINTGGYEFKDNVAGAIVVITSILMCISIICAGLFALPIQIQCQSYSGYPNIDIGFLGKFGCQLCAGYTDYGHIYCPYFTLKSQPVCSGISFPGSTCSTGYHDLQNAPDDLGIYC